MIDSNEHEGILPLEAWEGPAILLVDLDAFFASVEQLDHPGWRGKPVIVGGSADKHGVVSTASYEARKFGVHSAMPAVTARKLCPQAIWAAGRFDRYKKVSNQVMSILNDETPLVQQVSIDEAFLDVTPTRTNREHPVAVARRIQQRVEQLGVTCSVGVGTSKTVAKIASDMDKPRGLTIVYPGTERAFLDPLPVRSMSGIGAAAEQRLKSHGVETLGQLVCEGPARLERLFGKNGRVMYMRACGLDDSPIQQHAPVKSVSNEVTFANDLRTREDIEAASARKRRKLAGGCEPKACVDRPSACACGIPTGQTGRFSTGFPGRPTMSCCSPPSCAACLASSGNLASRCALSGYPSPDFPNRKACKRASST